MSRLEYWYVHYKYKIYLYNIQFGQESNFILVIMIFRVKEIRHDHVPILKRVSHIILLYIYTIFI